MIPYIGGKCRIAEWIISNFPKDFEKRTYIEVFGGAGWVLYKKPVSNLEVYNDLNSSLVNLFKTIRDNYDEFKHKSEWSLHSREMFKQSVDFIRQHQVELDVAHALNYAISRVQSFAGKGGSSWAYAKTGAKRSSGQWVPFLKRLDSINARLKLVQIEHLDFEKLIKKYDGPASLFYLDPPYVSAEHYYNSNEVCFNRVDHERLAKVLKKIKGKFCLSYYDDPLIRELYANFRIISKTTSKSSYGITKDSKTRSRPEATELLIMNY